MQICPATIQDFFDETDLVNVVSPNPDEPEPNKASLQNFLLNVQEFHGLGTKWRWHYKHKCKVNLLEDANRQQPIPV